MMNMKRLTRRGARAAATWRGASTAARPRRRCCWRPARRPRPSTPRSTCRPRSGAGRIFTINCIEMSHGGCSCAAEPPCSSSAVPSPFAGALLSHMLQQCVAEHCCSWSDPGCSAHGCRTHVRLQPCDPTLAGVKQAGQHTRQAGSRLRAPPALGRRPRAAGYFPEVGKVCPRLRLCL